MGALFTTPTSLEGLCDEFLFVGAVPKYKVSLETLFRVTLVFPTSSYMESLVPYITLLVPAATSIVSFSGVEIVVPLTDGLLGP